MADKDAKKIPSLHPLRLNLTEHQRRCFSIDVEAGLEPEDIVNPQFWAHIARELQYGDHVEANADDGSWYAEYLVLDVGANWAKVHLRQNSVERLQAVEPDSRPVILAGHSVKWAGRHAQFRVIRDADAKVLKEHLKNKADAYAWLESYSRSLAA